MVYCVILLLYLHQVEIGQVLVLCMHCSVILLKCGSTQSNDTAFQWLNSAECNISHTMSKHTFTKVHHSSV